MFISDQKNDDGGKIKDVYFGRRFLNHLIHLFCCGMSVVRSQLVKQVEPWAVSRRFSRVAFEESANQLTVSANRRAVFPDHLESGKFKRVICMKK